MATLLKALMLANFCMVIGVHANNEETKSFMPEDWCHQIAALNQADQDFFLNLHVWLQDVLATTRAVEYTSLKTIWADNYAHHPQTCDANKLLSWVGSEIGFWSYLQTQIESLSDPAKELLGVYRDIILGSSLDNQLLAPEEHLLPITAQWNIKILRMENMLRARLAQLVTLA